MQTNREPEPPLAFAVTTSARPSPRELASAHCLAGEIGYRYVPRIHRSLAGMAADERLTGLIVVERGNFSLWVAGRCLRYHPNMAKLRLLALEQGKHDILVNALQLKLGDRVLDCTCGLGADAIVAACKVGATGRVRSLEASPLLALLVERGMACYVIDDPPALVPAMRRVEVLNADYADYLRREAENAWDVVYFDPMFSETIADAQGLDLVRYLAQGGSPSPADLGEARRVARRRVVMKDRRPGQALARLGFAKVEEGRRVCYGALPAW
ncbi:MAG: class I SAM-dependent methyltransferase [Gemmatimonadota bacterium]|nr:class I SAM-dependent methyltransferase [Gemmatimonadota bacterium]